MSVEQYIASAAKAAGGKVTFKDAIRFEKGEGIEKKQENFAEELSLIHISFQIVHIFHHAPVLLHGLAVLLGLSLAHVC